MGKAGCEKTLASFTWGKVVDVIEKTYMTARAPRIARHVPAGRCMSPGPVPRVSIIVPAFNSERYIGTALASVLAQTYRDYEVVVVDDGSTDGTKAAVLAFGGPIRYIYQANQGPAAARNTGIDAARGELARFLDADDSWLPEKLGLQVEFMERNVGVGLVFSDEEEFDEHGVQCRSLVSTSRFYAEIVASPVIDPPHFGSCWKRTSSRRAW